MTRVLFLFSFITLCTSSYGSVYFPSEKLRDSLLVAANTAQREELADVYNQLALYYNIADPSKASEYIERALSLSQQLDYKKGTSFALKEKGMNLLQSGDILQALTFVEEAKLLSEEIGDYDLVGQSLHCMGLIYAESEFYEIANRYLNEALEAYKLAENDYISAFALYDLTEVYLKSRQYDKALEYVQHTIRLRERLNYQDDEGPLYLQLGKIYRNLQSDSIALIHYLKALDLIEKENPDGQVKGMILLEIGDYYLQKGNFDLANKYLHRAKAAIEKGPNLVLKGNIMHDLAEAFHMQGDHLQALTTVDSVLRIGDETHSIYLLSKALFLKAGISKSLGLEEAAFNELSRAYSLHDSISSVGFKSLIADKITSFETQRAEEKINGLNSELANKRVELDNKKAQLNLYLILGILFGGGLIIIVRNLLKMRKLTGQLTIVNHHVRQQNVELIQLNEENNDFIRLVAHDLRSPVNNIVSISELMKKEDISSDERINFLNLIDTICSKLDSTIAKFLDARLSLAQSRIVLPEAFEVSELLGQLIKEYTPKAATKKIQLSSSEIPRIVVHTDKTYVTQIISNLLSNAIKFSHFNTTIEVGLTETSDYFTVSVKDEGPGISEAEQTELFKMYTRTSNTPTANEPSTGIGLAIAKKMAEGLGGTIKLESKEGKGSVFTAIIPLELP